MRSGATPEQVMESVWVVAEIRAGEAYAHASLALTAIEEEGHRHDAAR